MPVRNLSHRLLLHLRKTQSNHGVDWEQLCVAHPAAPQFIFELLDDTVRLRLLAKSVRDKSTWFWNGHEWAPQRAAHQARRQTGNPRRPAAGPGDAMAAQAGLVHAGAGLVDRRRERKFPRLAGGARGPSGPPRRNFSATPAFHRLFLTPRQLKPRLVVKGSGIDWLAVSAEWEAEGLKLTKADLERLAAATSRFVKLPNSGWVELDTTRRAGRARSDGRHGRGRTHRRAAKRRHGTRRASGRRRIDAVRRFAGGARRCASACGISRAFRPPNCRRVLQAELRPYQKDGFDFLCHLAQIRLGGILADDMGLGKTLQTLAWLAWLQGAATRKNHKPSLVICPASVLHNWRREAERFTPDLKVLVLESGAARHNLRKQIPQHDLIVTNYALLRRDLEELQKFAFRAVILDEAQFIKNPGAQVTQSVKQLKCEHKLALTGTPLENRLLDLWSIVDFIQPGYLGNQEQFLDTYEPRAASNAESAQRIARRRLSAKLRPLLLRRLEEARREGFARPHRGTPRLPARRRAAQIVSGRIAPQPRPGDESRRDAGLEQEQDARARRAHAPAPDLLPSRARGQRHRLRQDRDAV